MTNNTIKFSTEEKDIGKRLDVVLTEKIPDLTRSNLKKIVESDGVKVDNLIVNSPSKKLKLKQSISIEITSDQHIDLKPAKIKLDIVYEDKDLLIVNKPVGMVVHPGAGNYKKTLVNALIYKYQNELSNINGNLRPGIVHRIDKDTSGLLVVAKNNISHSNLGKQFSEHKIDRTYVCLVWGVIRPLSGRIETLIARNKKNRQLMTVSDVNGKKAITNYKTLKVFEIKDIPKISLLECKLETGRTHQIRVHMKYKNSPLLGDKQYSKTNLKFKKINKDFEKVFSALKGQALHAKNLGFLHPTKNKFILFESELSKDFKKLLNLLKKLST
ncbi:RluA family pseudouridine synthase [Pelagibacteraceae bacterium]|nr:RluA family pseudouridine synthase [Pelagibacteraceae bacterium]